MLSLSGPHVREVELETPTRAEAQALAEQVLVEGKGPVHVAADIAKLTFDSPLATVIYAHIVARDRTNPVLLGNHDEVRLTILSRFEDVITGDIAKGKDVDRLCGILRVLALVQPVHPDEPTLLPLGASRRNSASRCHAIAEAADFSGHPISTRPQVSTLAGPTRGLHHRTLMHRIITTIHWLRRKGFEAAQPNYLKHILLNLGKLDWRQHEGDTSESELLSDLWKQLRWQETYFNPHVEAAEAVAYYQPKQALRFASHLIKEGHGSDHHVCAMVKNAAYNYQYLDEACALLWQGGRRDDRELNQHPSHAIRILKELASPEQKKPPQYVEKVAEFALSLLELPNSLTARYTPFDILEGALATEGHVITASTRRSITWSAFSVSPKSVAHIRKRIINALLKSIIADKPRMTCLAAQTLETALRGPHGVMGHHASDEERKVWRAEHEQTLKDLYSLLLQQQTVMPAVLVRIAQSVARHAYFGEEDKRDTPRKIIGLLRRDLRTRCIRALMDGWGTKTWPSDRVSHKRSEHEAEMGSLVKELSSQFPDAAALFEYVDGCLVEIKDMAASLGDHHIFVQRLIDENVNLAKRVVNAYFALPKRPLAQFGGFAFSTLLNKDSDAARERLDELLSNSTAELLQLVAEAYFRFNPKDGYTASDARALQTVFTSNDSTVLCYAARTLNQVAKHDKLLAVDLVTRVDLLAAGQAARDFLMWLGHEESIPLDVIRDDQLECLVSKLRELQDLDDYWVRAFLNSAMRRVAQSVIQLVKDRICDSLSSDERWIKPLDDGIEHEHTLGLLDLERGTTFLAALLDWALLHADDQAFLSRFGEALAGLCGNYGSAATEVFEAWMTGGSIGHVKVASAVLRHTYPDFIYDQDGFVHQILYAASEIDAQATEMLCSALYSSAATRGGTTTPGEPFSHDVKMKEHAEKKLQVLSRMDPAYELFRWLLEDANRGIEWQRREKEAMDAEEDEAH